MTRYLRYVLIIFTALTILLLALILYIAAIFDPNAYKAEVIQLVKEKKQRELKLDGNIKLTFFPRVGIRISHLALSEHESDVEFAAAETVLVSLAVLPLLRKRLELDGITITGLKANLIRFKDGRLNIHNLIARSEEPEQFELDVGQLLVKKSMLILSDKVSGRHFTLRNIDLEANRIDRSSGSKSGVIRRKTELAFLVNQPAQPEINLSSKLKFTVLLDVGKQSYAVEGMSVKSTGEIEGINNLVVNSSGGFSAKFDPDPAAAEFAVQNFLFDMAGSINGHNFDINVHAPGLSVVGQTIFGDPITVLGNATGTAGKGSGKFAVAGMSGSLSDFASGLTFELEAAKEDFTVQATFVSPLSGSLTALQFNLSDLTGMIRASSAAMPDWIAGSLTGSASVDAMSRKAQAYLTAQLAGSDMVAKLAASGSGQPGLNFEVDIDQLDLDRFSPLERRPEKGAKPMEAAIASGEWLDLSLLNELNAEGSIRIGLLKAGDSRATGVKLDIISN
ncbi:MAG: AsmA family protein [Nitrosospira sp.]|nr:AsmA family protein [Nitrosospira sp.]